MAGTCCSCLVATKEDGARMPAVGRLSCGIGLRVVGCFLADVVAVEVVVPIDVMGPAAFTGRR